ncbi:hypothetical protein TNCV_560911 [Trichonephila clavipes]|nr:hypothetical protein TNCV_560911 [Trichonephila clavipes]
MSPKLILGNSFPVVFEARNIFIPDELKRKSKERKGKHLKMDHSRNFTHSRRMTHIRPRCALVGQRGVSALDSPSETF